MIWKTTTIDEIKSEKKYSLVGGPFGSDLTGKHYVEFGVPVIRGTNLPFNKNFSSEDFVYVSEEKANKLLSNTAYPGDIIFTQRGTLGQVGIVPFDKFDRYIVSQSQMKLTIDNSKSVPLFVYYYFKTKECLTRIDNLALSSGVPHINLGILKNFKIPNPPLPIQNKIASILSSYDDLIENNKERIKLLEKMAEEIYKEWFVRLRFPGYETSKIVDGLPEGWERKPIASFVNIISGYAFKTETFDSEGIYKLVTIKNVQDGFFVTQTTDYIFELPKNLKEDCKLKDKDVILSLTGNIGRICLVYGDNYLLNQRVAKLKPKQKNYFEFVYLMFRSSFLRTTLENLSNGAAQQNLSPIEMGKLEFLFPSEDVINKFSELTKSFFDEIITLNKKNQLLQETRDLLLPRLISGKLSLEHLVEEELGMVAEPRAEYKKA